MRSQRFQKIFDKLAAAEERFLARDFLAPAVSRGVVRVRIAGVACALCMKPAGFRGWGIFRPSSHTSAELVAPAGLAERRRYLELFPTIGFVVCGQQADRCMAAPSHRGDRRFQVEGLVPLLLAEETRLFDRVRARFDGSNFWFDARDGAQDPATAASLRKSLEDLVDPDKLARPGLTPEERDAYAVNFAARGGGQTPEFDGPAGRLRQALKHGGGELVDFLERPDGYRVTYALDGQERVCAVDKDKLNLQVAGICLSGEDGRFDLASLVGVIREAEGTGSLLPIGQENRGMDETQYWNVHPPRP